MSDSTPGRITLTLNGTAVEAAPGQSVAAVMTGNGITAWRQTRRRAKPRGLFCGIGVCYDCLVTINGVTNQRACMVEATDGTSVEGEFNT